MIPGETINLRAVERRDAPLLYRWCNDPVVMDGWGWSAPARSMQTVTAQVEDWLAREIVFGRPEALIAESLAGDPVGLIIVRTDRPEARSVELSLLVDADHWGQGFGFDITETTLEACFNGWGVHRIGVCVEEGNVRALALYRRLGFKEEGRLRQAAFRDGRYADVLLFSLLADEWSAHHNLPHDPAVTQRVDRSVD
jgi:RimJ/RimL family protein N-acetyltransferase